MDKDDRISSADFRDNNIEWVQGDTIVTASFHAKKYINKVKRLAEQYPDEVDYKENKDGTIICHFPLRYVKISHPATRELTEEQRQASRERFAAYRAMKKETND